MIYPYKVAAQQNKNRSAMIEKDPSYWIFELNSDGIILHSSPHPPECSDPTMMGANGANFFDDISGFRDMSEIKRRFKMFLATEKPTDIFYTEYELEETSFPAKIRFTKTYQYSIDLHVPLVMMEIKGGDNGLFRR